MKIVINYDNDNALTPRDDSDSLYMPKIKREDDLSASKIALMHRNNNSKKKKREGREIIATINNADNTSINRTEITRKQNGKKNHSMDSSCDKQMKSHTRKLGHG